VIELDTTMGHRRRLLEYVVERYDRRERPVRPAEAASDIDIDESVATQCLAAFADCHLVVSEGRGYRPTVTARELLALEWDGAVVDPCPDSGEL
jgi:predicted transcriptional regulator